MLGMGDPYLTHVIRVELHLSIGLLRFLHRGQWETRTPFAVVGVTDCLLSYITLLGGSMSSSYGSIPHSELVRHCMTWMVKRSKQLTHHALSRAWVLDSRFGFLHRYRQHCVELLTLLSQSLVSWDKDHLPSPLILKLILSHYA
jgi:hypothetical protein